MRKTLSGALAFAAILLQGCGSLQPPQPQQLSGKAGSDNTIVAATLATTPCERATAAGMTAIHIARIRTTRAAERGQITSTQGWHLIELADKARETRKLACIGDEVFKPGVALFAADVTMLLKTLEDYRANR